MTLMLIEKLRFDLIAAFSMITTNSNEIHTGNIFVLLLLICFLQFSVLSYLMTLNSDYDWSKLINIFW